MLAPWFTAHREIHSEVLDYHEPEPLIQTASSGICLGDGEGERLEFKIGPADEVEQHIRSEASVTELGEQGDIDNPNLVRGFLRLATAVRLV